MVPVFFSSGASSMPCVSTDLVNELYAMLQKIHASSSMPLRSVLSTIVLAEPEPPTSMTGLRRLSIMLLRKSTRVESIVGTKMLA